MKKFGIVLFVAGLAGFGLGLAYAWTIAPIHRLDTTPVGLRDDYKGQFRAAISAAYSATGNLERARARLALLGEPDNVAALSAQAQRVLAGGESFQQAQELARLSSDLQAGVSSIPQPTFAAYTSAPPLSSPPAATISPSASLAAGESLAPPSLSATATPSAQKPTPAPTSTPIRTASAPFQLINRDDLCNPSLTPGLLQVTVLDSGGQSMPAIEILVIWAEGEERFFTGLKPEINDGYADYIMQDGTEYSLVVAGAGAPISDLRAPSCTGTGGSSYLGEVALTFKEP